MGLKTEKKELVFIINTSEYDMSLDMGPVYPGKGGGVGGGTVETLRGPEALSKIQIFLLKNVNLGAQNVATFNINDTLRVVSLFTQVFGRTPHALSLR